MGVLTDLGAWLWRLAPGNPILVRVISMGGKRTRHLWTRFVYLGVLFLVLLIFGTGSLAGGGSLADLAKKSSVAFMAVSFMQLAMMSFIAPIFTAGAITQEKDANTFHILLTTPLSDAQIVLGSLLSRLYFVWVMLLSGLPIFCITMIYGGVTSAEVFLSLALSASTALVMGAVAIAISISRVGTRRTIFSFFVGVAAYMIGLWAVGVSPWGQLPEAPASSTLLPGAGTTMRMSWLAPVHPFMALLVVTGVTPPPLAADVAKYGQPWAWMLTHPEYAFIVNSALLSIVMVVYSLFFVRRGMREGEVTWMSRLREFLRRGDPATQTTRRPRSVWDNPISWREACTKGSAGGKAMIRWIFVVAGVVTGGVLVLATARKWWRLTPATSEEWILTLVWIELGVILLVVTNTAATTLTREKESLTMELLLSTPLTSRYIIFGMLRGLVSFVLPLVAVPAATLLFFLVWAGLNNDWQAALGWFIALLCVPLLMISYASVAAMIGLQFSLLSRKTVQAVMTSTGIVIGACALLSSCGVGLAQASQFVAAVVYPFTPFPAMIALISPRQLIPVAGAAAGSDLEVRSIVLVSSFVAAGVYALITWSMHSNMVRSFDMTVRRQAM